MSRSLFDREREHEELLSSKAEECMSVFGHLIGILDKGENVCKTFSGCLAHSKHGTCYYHFMQRDQGMEFIPRPAAFTAL